MWLKSLQLIMIPRNWSLPSRGLFALAGMRPICDTRLRNLVNMISETSGNMFVIR